MGHTYRDLLAWRKARHLTKSVYEATSQFPPREQFGLTSQMRRAAVSIASNIAEGQARLTKGEFLQSLGHARGSAAELQTQIVIAYDLHYLSAAECRRLGRESGDVLGLINLLIQALQNRQASAPSLTRSIGVETLKH